MKNKTLKSALLVFTGALTLSLWPASQAQAEEAKSLDQLLKQVEQGRIC